MREKYINLAEEKLTEAKALVKLFGLDFDGTISDGKDFKLPEAMALVQKILSNGKSAAIITARAATAIKNFVPPLQEILGRLDESLSIYVAGGNGTTLYKITKDNSDMIYNHGFVLEQIFGAVEAGKKVYEKLGIKREDLAENGIETFKKFLQEDFDGYIPPEILDVCRPYDGEFFTEEAKVTFVLPKDKSLHGKVVDELNAELGDSFRAVAGDETYVHITRRLQEDSKRVAIKSILQLTNLAENEVVTFGDMPMGNDAGLLSFPYSFTNSDEFIEVKKDLESPPYLLLDTNISPVARIHEAIKKLIS